MSRIALLLAMVLLMASTGRAGVATTSTEARCVRLESRIADLRLKLRLGYGAAQGRIYRHKLATLEAERRHLCRR